MDGDAYNCTRVHMAVVWRDETADGSAAVEVNQGEISDLVHSQDRLSLQSMRGRSMSCYSIVSFFLSLSLFSTTIKVWFTGRVNKLGMMSKMWFPALENSSSYFLSLRHLWSWASGDSLIYFVEDSYNQQAQRKKRNQQTSEALKWKIWTQKVNLNVFSSVLFSSASWINIVSGNFSPSFFLGRWIVMFAVGSSWITWKKSSKKVFKALLTDNELNYIFQHV